MTTVLKFEFSVTVVAHMLISLTKSETVYVYRSFKLYSSSHDINNFVYKDIYYIIFLQFSFFNWKCTITYINPLLAVGHLG
jgi:hypothetical protein